MLEVVENPRAVVAVDAVPVRPPTKVVAVIIPVPLNSPFPTTVSVDVGFVVPIPTKPELLILITSVLLAPNAN